MVRDPAATDCPSVVELQSAIEHIVQRSLVSPSTERLMANVEFRRGDSGFSALVRLTGAKQGERLLTDTGGSCAPLAI